MPTERIEFPPKLRWLFGPPHGALRWRGAYGGRGGGKSHSAALMAAIRGYEAKRRILCARDIQISIRESFYAELVEAIMSRPWLEAFYKITKESITGYNGTEFIFRGLRYNLGSLKSLAKVDIAIIEEAEDVSEAAWLKLVPTIRKRGSEFWPLWNPQRRGSPIDQRMRQNPPPRSRVVEINYNDNPFFGGDMEETRLHDMRVLSPEVYAHIWDGHYLENTEAQVLSGKWRVDQFEPSDDWAGPYHGLDFGFSQDPTAGTKSWIAEGDGKRRLMIEREAVKKRLELDHTAAFLKAKIPGIEKYEVLADNSRPESISHLRRPDMLPKIKAAKKWKGSVEDGIAYMRGFDEIVIHERCKETKSEAVLYSHKVDRHSGQVMPEIVDAHNHCMDSIRYGHDKPIRRAHLAWGSVGSAR